MKQQVKIGNEIVRIGDRVINPATNKIERIAWIIVHRNSKRYGSEDPSIIFGEQIYSSYSEIIGSTTYKVRDGEICLL
jgi:hypothetical protein